MIDVDDSDILAAMFTRAAKLAQLDDQRLARELRTIQERAAAAFVAAGDDELSAWFRADAILQRLLELIENRRRRVTPGGGEKV